LIAETSMQKAGNQQSAAPGRQETPSGWNTFAPLSAAAGVLAAMLCCLPLPLAFAVGTAGLSAVVAPLRSWFMGLSVVLLVWGFVQVYRQPEACRRTSTISLIVLWASAILVVIALMLPQWLATMAADWVG
jgi:hypothetical protein